MVKTIAILLVTAVIMMIDVPTMWKNKQKKELIAYLVLLLTGIILLILLAVGVKIPSPVDLFSSILKPFNNFFQ